MIRLSYFNSWGVSMKTLHYFMVGCSLFGATVQGVMCTQGNKDLAALGKYCFSKYQKLLRSTNSGSAIRKSEWQVHRRVFSVNQYLIPTTRYIVGPTGRLVREYSTLLCSSVVGTRALKPYAEVS